MDVYPFLSGVVPAAGGEPPNRAAIVCLFAHFRLLQTCERASHEGSLDSIDAVLGCPGGLFEVGSALVDGLAAYEGGLVLISHDGHLIDSVVAGGRGGGEGGSSGAPPGRLWCVEGGRVTPFDGGFAAYRRKVKAAAAAGMKM